MTNHAPKDYLLSIVVPVFNEEEVIAEFIQRTQAVAQKLKCRYELVFVDDGSKDKTLKILVEEKKKDPQIKIIKLSRNFGHQIAITAGLDEAQGDAIVSIDADLQDPPELIPEMISLWKEGKDIIYAKRKRRLGETFFKTYLSAISYRLIRKISGCDIPVDVGDFRLLSRKALDALNQMRERYRYIRGLVAWLGYPHAFVEYVRQPRYAGVTKYPFFKLLRLSFDGISAFSILPIRLATFLGFASSAGGLLYIPYAIYRKLFYSGIIEGWATIVSAIFFMSGVQLICLGVIGEYIGMMHLEVKHRPLYVISEVL